MDPANIGTKGRRGRKNFINMMGRQRGRRQTREGTVTQPDGETFRKEEGLTGHEATKSHIK